MVTMIARNYNLVAYHNFSHAFYLTLVIPSLFSSTINASKKNLVYASYVAIKNTSI